MIGELVDEEKREEQSETGKLHKSKDAQCCQAPRMPEKDGFVMRNHVRLSDPSEMHVRYRHYSRSFFFLNVCHIHFKSILHHM